MSTLNDGFINEIMERNARMVSSNRLGTNEVCASGKNPITDSLIRCLIESNEGVFSTMCGWEMESGPSSRHDGFATRHDISGIIGLTGSIKATVVVSVDEDLVFAVAEAILGERPNKINSEVVDLVGELANMIGGNAKERLSLPNVVLGLPTVVAGAGHYVAYNSQMAVTMIPFQCQHGSMSIELGIV